jgi:hypothetical protein
VIAVLVGTGSGLGAVIFRYLIYFFTWLVTGLSRRRAAGARFPLQVSIGVA